MGLDASVGGTQKAIAEQLDVPPSRVKSTHRAAINALRDRIRRRSSPASSALSEWKATIMPYLGREPHRRFLMDAYLWGRANMLDAKAAESWVMSLTAIFDDVTGTKHRRRYAPLVVSCRTEYEKGDPDLPVETAADVVDRLVARTWFPPEVRLVDAPMRPHRQARAAKSEPGRWKANAREEVFESARDGYHGVFANSLTERAWLGALDEATDLIASYQEQPRLPIVYRRRGDPQPKSYTPDVLVELADRRRIIVEIKPIRTIATADTLARAIAARRHAEREGWGYALVSEEWRGLLDLHRRRLRNPDACRRAAHLLNSSGQPTPVSALAERGCAAVTDSFSDLVAFCVQHNFMLVSSDEPFVLQRVPEGFGWDTLVPADPLGRCASRSDRR
jgi:hypothetical protein